MSDRNYLVEPVPTAPVSREALGIFQSDVIVRTAIQAGLADIRANPDLLKYIFAGLPADGLTFSEYGDQQVKAAEEWFLSQEIPVFMNTRIDESKIPCITIGIQTSQEQQATLGDLHYETSEEAIVQGTTTYFGPLNPSNYAPATGILSLPSDFEGEIVAGMAIQSRSNKVYVITEVLDPWTLVIDKNINEDLVGIRVVSTYKKQVTLESLEFKEVFEIGCHVIGEPIYLTYLHSILLFILLRYKEELLEARHLERTTVQSGPTLLNTSFPTTQPVFTRMITLQGFVRQYWPKFLKTPVEGIGYNLDVQLDVVTDAGEDTVTIWSSEDTQS